MKFTFTNVISTVFIIYVANSIWTLVQLFLPPTCNESGCLKSYITSSPDLQLLLYTSTKRSIGSFRDLSELRHINSFDYKNTRILNLTVPVPPKTRKNGTLYIHAFMTPSPKYQESKEQSVQSPYTMYTSFSLTQYLVPAPKTFNLLGGSDEPLEPKKQSVKPIAHLCKYIELNIMTDLHKLPKNGMPGELFQMIRIVSSDMYLPPFKFDSFSSRVRNYYEINATDDTYDLQVQYTPASVGSLRMAAQFEAAMEMMKTMGFTNKDLDEMKGIFADTNIYLLGVTIFVASFHLLFDFLAFKNDIVYWKHRKTTVGLSLKTILWRCFSTIVVFLYLMEERSSLLVTIPGGIGAVIEIWKVTKAFKMSFSLKFPFVKFGQMSDLEKATAQHDTTGMKYLSYLLYPLCIGGAVYSLLYTPHKSWYSWTIQSLVNGVYAFGFLFMLPQLYLNYKLKSVAHMNFRSFMYKAFNTFIDDLFAFIIHTPYSHKVATFRDDVCFFIYLYQRWLYPVDKSRMDSGGEFETSLEVETGKTEVEKKAD